MGHNHNNNNPAHSIKSEEWTSRNFPACRWSSFPSRLCTSSQEKQPAGFGRCQTLFLSVHSSIQTCSCNVFLLMILLALLKLHSPCKSNGMSFIFKHRNGETQEYKNLNYISTPTGANGAEEQNTNTLLNLKIQRHNTDGVTLVSAAFRLSDEEYCSLSDSSGGSTQVE